MPVSESKLEHLRQIAPLGGYARAASVGRSESTAAARSAFMHRFEAMADPDGKLDPDERAWRAERLRRKYFADLARRSVRARRRKAADL